MGLAEHPNTCKCIDCAAELRALLHEVTLEQALSLMTQERDDLSKACDVASERSQRWAGQCGTRERERDEAREHGQAMRDALKAAEAETDRLREELQGEREKLRQVVEINPIHPVDGRGNS